MDILEHQEIMANRGSRLLGPLTDDLRIVQIRNGKNATNQYFCNRRSLLGDNSHIGNPFMNFCLVKESLAVVKGPTFHLNP